MRIRRPLRTRIYEGVAYYPYFVAWVTPAGRRGHLAIESPGEPWVHSEVRRHLEDADVPEASTIIYGVRTTANHTRELERLFSAIDLQPLMQQAHDHIRAAWRRYNWYSVVGIAIRESADTFDVVADGLEVVGRRADARSLRAWIHNVRLGRERTTIRVRTFPRFDSEGYLVFRTMKDPREEAT